MASGIILPQPISSTSRHLLVHYLFWRTDYLGSYLTRCRGLHQEISVRLSRGKAPWARERKAGRVAVVIPVVEPTC